MIFSAMCALRYRFATCDDAALLARLNAQLIESGADFGPADPAWLEQRMRRWLRSGHDRAVLFEAPGGQTLAYAVYQEQGGEIYLRQFLVLDAARRHGVGRQAFALLRERIWSPGKRLTLEVLTANRAAYRFWRSLGYRNCAVTLEIPAPPAQRQAATLDAAPWLRRLSLRAHGAVLTLYRCAGVLLFALLPIPPAMAAALEIEARDDGFAPIAQAPVPREPPPETPQPSAGPSPGPSAGGIDGLSDMELRVLRASGGRCAASIYRGAWSAARTYRMEPAWVAAMIETESSCRPEARSRAGALGLMQLMPGSGARDAYRLVYGRDAAPGAALLRDPQANIRLGVAYLSGLHQHFLNIGSAEARLLLAVASYNCGTDLFDRQLPAAAAGWDAGQAGRWIAAHAPRQTRGYVRRVRGTALRYAAALSAAQGATLALR